MCQYKVLVFDDCSCRRETMERVNCIPKLEEGLYICSTDGTIDWKINGKCGNCKDAERKRKGKN